MPNKECPICFEKIGKIYKELECGHRFHFNCITIYEKLKEQKNLNCPYCRKKYSVMKLRDRIPKVTPEEKKRKKELCNIIKSKLNNVAFESDKSKKVIIVNSIFSLIISNIDMIKDIKFGFKPIFSNVVLFKLSELSLEINNQHNKNEISKNDYDIFNNNKITIEHQLSLFYKN